MTAILGISALYHDSAAALVVDGRIVAAAEEERFSREKHDARFPVRAIEYCLAEGGLRAEDLDYVAFYDKALLKLERLVETYLAFAPRGLSSFVRGMPALLKEKLFVRRAIVEHLGGSPKAKIVFLDHHESHAASAFFPSPFDDAAILTLDGVGEWSTASFGAGEGNRIALTHQLRFPHSLGLLYSAFTHYCGFKVNGGEYKLMGLAPYGRPTYAAAIREHLVDLQPDGSLWLDQKYFAYCHGLTMTSGDFHRLFGGPPREPEADIEQRHMDLAASIQSVTEEAVLAMARHVRGATGKKNLVLAGGVALNAVANGLVSREGPFESLWIQPAAGDSGGALGAALFVWHQLLEWPRQPQGRDAQQGSLLGPQWSSQEVGRILEEQRVAHEHLGDEQALLAAVVDELVAGKVVGWFRGRMEFGPRALGARSILGDPRAPAMQQTLNTRIKFRESFRPFAPAVLRDHAHEWFDIAPEQESPYMLQVAPVLERHRVTPSAEDAAVMRTDPDLRRRVNVVRSAVPAVTHVDFSARLQTVDAERNPAFHRLLDAFFARTGCPMLVNTSFNVRGEPIVCSPLDALRCFRATDMDTLVLEDRIVRKEPGRGADRHRPPSRSEHPRSRSKAAGIAPTTRVLRQFAVLWLLFFGGAAAWRLEVRHQPIAAAALGTLALLVGGAGLLKPSLVRPVFVGWMRVARPIGEVVSTIVVGAVFLALFVPAALLQRALGRDALALREPRGRSHWKPRAMASDVRRYLRQS
jgi:carbamoyltransferase